MNSCTWEEEGCWVSWAVEEMIGPIEGPEWEGRGIVSTRQRFGEVSWTLPGKNDEIDVLKNVAFIGLKWLQRKLKRRLGLY